MPRQARPERGYAAYTRDTQWCPVQIASRSGGFILDGAYDGRENGTRNAAAGYLADDAADIRRRSRIGEQWNQHSEDLSAGAATDGTRKRVSQCPEIDILGGACGDISADGAADDLYDEINE
jgi:hypothetical protein